MKMTCSAAALVTLDLYSILVGSCTDTALQPGFFKLNVRQSASHAVAGVTAGNLLQDVWPTPHATLTATTGQEELRVM